MNGSDDKENSMSTETKQGAGGFICLYFGNPEECQCCGGWTKAEGGPFVGDPRFCSEDCYADYQDRYEAASKKPAWCPDCGYDQGEHGPDCEAASTAAVKCPGGCGCRLGTDDADRLECGCDEGCCE